MSNANAKSNYKNVSIEEKKVMYNHSIDKKGNKWGEGEKLLTISINEMPKYIKENLEKYKPWLESSGYCKVR